MTIRLHRVTSQRTWAVLSNTISPVVVLVAIALAIPLHDGRTIVETIVWSGVYIGLFIMPGVAYTLQRVRKGKAEDIHLPNRHERYGPFVLGLCSSAVVLVVLPMIGASGHMIAFSRFTALISFLLTVITFRWKISVHSTVIGGAVVLVAGIFGLKAALVLSPLVPLVGIARVALGRHTLAQVLAGTMLGLTTSALILTRR